MTERVLVLGASGFIGSALVARLKMAQAYVCAVDNRPFVRISEANELHLCDLRHGLPAPVMREWDVVVQLAADVGGVAYLSGGHDADVMADNVAINRNVAQWAVGRCGVLVFTSSACVYPADDESQLPWREGETSAPANDYGAEKLFSERMYQAHARDHGLNVRIARLGNVYGPGEPIDGPRAHLVGDLCRKALKAPKERGVIEVWGDGSQVRSMLYIDDAVDGLIALAHSSVAGPVNIAGPPYSVAEMAGILVDRARLGGHVYVPGPTGAHSSALDVSKARVSLGWTAQTSLKDGLRATYDWARAA